MTTGGQANTESRYGLGAIWRDLEKVSYLTKGGFTLQTLAGAVKTVMITPITALLSVISISAALFLFGFFLLVFQNTSEMLQSASTDFGVSVYLTDKVRPEQRDAIFDSLSELPEVEAVELWTKDKALSEFETVFAEFKGVTEGLAKDNPLPSSFEVTFKPGVSHDRYRALVDQFKETPGVLHVTYEHELLEQINGLMSFIKKSGAAAVIVVLLITGFVIASTIRLALYNRQDELQIMHLVGATAWFIKIPCLFEGFLFGFVGGLVGLISLLVFFVALQQSMLGVTLLTQFADNLEFLSFSRIALVLGVGIAVGLVASSFAARRITHVRQ